jgi:HD-GYP domain-containing protein (c-di-GMP phosphodiesterase class II)
MGLELEDGIRACYVADCIAEEMQLDPADRLDAYYATLLKDAGCTSWTAPEADFWQTPDEIEARRELLSPTGLAQSQGFIAWLRRYAGEGQPLPARIARMVKVAAGSGPFLKEGYESTVEVCKRMTGRLGLPVSAQAAVLSIFEMWNGKGMPDGLQGEQIPVASRVVSPCFPIPFLYRVAGPEAAVACLQQERGKSFDPAVSDAFLRVAERAEFWEAMGSPDILRLALEREPESDLKQVGARGLDDLAFAFADYVDLKSPYAAAHSRRVARVTEQLAALMSCSTEDAALYRNAGLLHDLGVAAVPSAALDTPERALTSAQREQIRLHPYYAERILDRVPALEPVRPHIGAHHERMDGRGFFRGLSGDAIPLGARLIAVANRLDELTHDSPDAAALSPTEAVAAVEKEAPGNYDPQVVAALRQALGGVSAPSTPREWPAGLTDREVDVLRAAARGLSRREIAQSLVISEATARHHLEHIYDKTGCRTRVAAILFAMENDLLP